MNLPLYWDMDNADPAFGKLYSEEEFEDKFKAKCLMGAN